PLSTRSRRILHLFSFTTPAPTYLYTLSLHDALPIYRLVSDGGHVLARRPSAVRAEREGTDFVSQSSLRRCAQHRAGRRISVRRRSEEHTSELQSPYDLVCRLLLEKKKQRQEYTSV